MATNDIYSVAIGWLCDGVNYTNVMHFEQTNADGGEDPEAVLAGGVADHIQTTLLPILSDSCKLVSVTAKAISPTERQPRTLYYDVAGGVSGDSYPSQSNVTTTFYTDDFNRTGRGRFRLSGIPAGVVTHSNVEASFISNLADFWTAILNVWSAAGSALTWGSRVWSVVDTAAQSIHHIKTHANVRKQRTRRK